MRVAVRDDRTTLTQEFHYVNGTRIAHVTYPTFKCSPEAQDARPAQRDGAFIQNILHSGDDISRHLVVDVGCQLNEPCLEVVLASLPRQIKRVYWNAMSTWPDARIKRLKAERFGSSSVNHTPYIDTHFMTQLGQFVDEGDVDCSIRVF